MPQFCVSLLPVSFFLPSKKIKKMSDARVSERKRERNDGLNLLWTRRFFFLLSATTAAAAFSSFTIFSHSRMVRYWLLFFLVIYTQDIETRWDGEECARGRMPIEEKWKKVGQSGCSSVRPFVGERLDFSCCSSAAFQSKQQRSVRVCPSKI